MERKPESTAGVGYHWAAGTLWAEIPAPKGRRLLHARRGEEAGAGIWGSGREPSRGALAARAAAQSRGVKEIDLWYKGQETRRYVNKVALPVGNKVVSSFLFCENSGPDVDIWAPYRQTDG